MQQSAAGAIVLVAEIEVERCYLGSGWETQPALLLLQVALERHGGRLGGHRAQALADLQAVADQAHGPFFASAEHRLDRLVQFGNPGIGQVAHGRQRLGEPHRLDDVGGGGVESLIAQQSRRVGDPADRRRSGAAQRCSYQPGEVTPAP